MSTQLLRVIVADDERPARDRVTDLLRHHSDVEICATLSDGAAVVAAIDAHAPHVAFLDIQMPGISGIDVMRSLGPGRMPATVLVTAFERYAIQAFDAAAVDYLLKPFEDSRFEAAFRRARHQVARSASTLALPVEPSPVAPQVPYLDRVAVESRGQIRSVSVHQIDYITASGVYAEIHTGGRQFLLRERMQVFEERLDPALFMRIHRSIIVRLDRIEMLIRHPGGDYKVALLGGVQLAVSRNRIEMLERWMGVDALKR